MIVKGSLVKLCSSLQSVVSNESNIPLQTVKLKDAWVRGICSLSLALECSRGP